jgi:hypothetical protein
MSKPFLGAVILGVFMLVCVSFIQKNAPGATKERGDTMENYENQIKVPVIRDSIPPPMPPDTLPAPPDSLPVPPIPDSIPNN